MDYIATINDQDIDFSKTENDGSVEYHFGQKSYRASISEVNAEHLVLTLNGRVYDVVLDRSSEPVSALINGKTFTLSADSARRVALRKRIGKTVDKSSGEKTIKAPMPGLVLRINVAAGDKVCKGDGLLVIEAMKMENEIKAPVDAVVESVLVADGDAVDKNTVMIMLA